VLGWLDQAPPNVEVKDNRLSQLTTALVYTSLDYQFPDSGPILLPVGMIPGSLTKIPPNGGTCSSNEMVSVSMGAGEAEFQYQIPAELNQYKVTSLKLNLWRDNGSLVDMPAISLWDWTANQWTTIQSPILGVNIIKSPAAYIGENGLVHIQMKNESNTFSCYYLDLGLEAEQAPGGGAH
jgi:hypothetical protein